MWAMSAPVGGPTDRVQQAAGLVGADAQLLLVLHPDLHGVEAGHVEQPTVRGEVDAPPVPQGFLTALASAMSATWIRFQMSPGPYQSFTSRSVTRTVSEVNNAMVRNAPP